MLKATKLSIADTLFQLSRGFRVRKIIINGSSIGRAEVHEFQHDLYVPLAGKATVQVGRLTSRIEKTTEGELRSDSMDVTEEFEVHAGDILFIPAGLAHRVVVDEFYQQWVFKIDHEC